MSDIAELKIVLDAAINYAFQQNAIPVVKELWLRNGELPRQDVVIRLTTEPGFAKPIEVRLQSLAPGAEFRAAPVDLKLSHDFLAEIPERVAGWLRIEVSEGETILHKTREPIALLARNEWCGLVSLPEILAAFVLPNDPAVMAILGRGAELLRANTGRAAFNGYQDKSRKRAWEQAAAIYRAIAELGIRYISPPASFEMTGQKVRFPSDIVQQRFGTCLDTALLVAACCEQAGLHPLVLIHDGHAYAGLWLEDQTLVEAAVDDLQQIRKLRDLGALTVLETTALTDESPGTLDQAELLAREHLGTTLPFRLALDVHGARQARIRPLPIPGQALPGDPAQLDPDAVQHGLGSREIREAITPPTGPAKAATRIDQWKNRLLDLSLRNRLLNFRETKSTVRILSAAPEQVEDELAAERELALLPKPRLLADDAPRDTGTMTRQQRADVLAEHLREELARKRLHSILDDQEHRVRLTELFRSARTAIEENGTNTLFAAVGLLEWRQTEYSDRVLRAPLLLVPVELKRKSVLEGFSLRRLDEETRLNVTLMEMLRQDFRLEIAGLDPLPEDDHGVDVGRVFQLFRDAVRNLPGWEVKSEIWLGQFSFTKFLLWKDLSDRLEDLSRNRIVKHLVEEAGSQYDNPPDDIKAAGLDDRFHPKEVFCPRSADSSQLAAVMAAAAGHDFVLEGPPGTGKSQTITNIIAHCLANGKRVLFVAEKRAALDVVHRRLREDGLEPFCLELHSNKTGKAEVLAQFDRALRFVSQGNASDWERRATELEEVRHSLNRYADALHEIFPCGLSTYGCFDYLLPRRDEPTVKLDAWSSVLETPFIKLERAREIARLLQERSRPLAPLAGHPLALVTREDWTPSWQDQVVEQLSVVAKGARDLEETADAVRSAISIGEVPKTRTDIDALAGLAESLLSAEPVGGDFIRTPWQQVQERIDTCVPLLRERVELRRALAGYDEHKLLTMDIEDLNRRANDAVAAWWLPRWFKLRGLARLLSPAKPDGAAVDPKGAVSTIRSAFRLRQIAAELLHSKPLLGALWNDGEPHLEVVERARGWGERLNATISASCSNDTARETSVRSRLAGIIAGYSPGVAPMEPVRARLLAFLDAWRAFNKAWDELAVIAGVATSEFNQAADFASVVGAFVEKLNGASVRLREWSSWRRVRREALELGLLPLVSMLESAGSQNTNLPELFERSFRKALLYAAIESRAPLRDFFGREHGTRIEKFRDLDERLQQLARDLISARLAAEIPGDEVRKDIPKQETALLRKEIGKKMRHIPVRKLIASIPTLLPRLKPCVLMSPLSVAQYLDAAHSTFDVVIFDEASQIPVWDAVGAIARGAQLIVVGDPKQLPPTNFFTSTDDDEEDLAPPEFKDLESILDELMTNGLRHKRLQWHYRSRHEGLISFSNRQYYENELLTFPSPAKEGGGVQFRYLSEARYDKGKSRTNRLEAEALVAELVARLRQSDGPARSYGVVTFSQAQQSLVENLLDEERRKHPEIEIHFGDEPPIEGEPVFVKNLENVQGDERDVILFSICYGPDETGKVSMNFGPLNRVGGERRLNVAVTRAKQEVLVFSGLRADQIDLTRTRARGVRDLKLFLDYAERGTRALATASAPRHEGEAESEFEHMVAARLVAAGYEVHHQVGASDYRIDLAIVDPADPSRYLLGIECDGATYHRAATARDRDKLRQAVLEGLGWKLYRIWSTDWWHDTDAEMAKLIAAIESLARAASGDARGDS